MTPLRIGLVGLGRHGMRYARHLAAGDVPEARLAAFWRRNAGKGRESARDLGVRFEPDLEALAADPEIDAFVAAVPAGEHERVAAAVARSRKPLLLEKPMARTVTECRRIQESFAAAGAGAPLMIAQTLRFDPLVARLAERTAELAPIRGFTFEQRLEPRGLAWEEDPEPSGGGVLIQTGIHVVDTLRFVSRAERVEVLGAATAHVRGKRTEDHGAMTLCLSGGPLLAPGTNGGAAREASSSSRGTPFAPASKDGVIGTVSASKLGDSRHIRFALFFERGGLEADLIGRTLAECLGRTRTFTEIQERPTVVEVVRAFAACVGRGAPNPVPAEEGLASLAVIEAAYAAARIS